MIYHPYNNYASLIKKNKDENRDAGKQQAIILPLHSANRSLDFLVEIIDTIRPAHSKDIAQANLRFKALLYQLSQDKSSCFLCARPCLPSF